MKSKINFLIGSLIIFTAIIWSAIFNRQSDQSFHLYMLDVGQGMAIYIRFPDGFDVLYDGGPDDKILAELGDVMPAWDREINLMISSHNHADHLVGLIDVLEKYKVNEVWTSGAIHTTETYKKFLQAIDKSSAKLSACYVEMNGRSSLPCPSPDIPNGKISILYPFDNLTGQRPENQNNASLVAKVEYGDTSILLPGEIETEAEVEIVQYYDVGADQRVRPKSDLQSDILQSPHQGSHSSSTADFLQAVDSTDVLIAVGAGNQYGHPHKDVLARYKNMGFNVYRTDLCGRIEVMADLNNYKIISNCPK